MKDNNSDFKIKYVIKKILKLFLLVILDLEGVESKELKKQSLPMHESKAILELQKVEEDDLRSLRKKQKKTLNLIDVVSNVEKNFPLLLATLQDLMIARSELITSQGAFDSSVRSASTASTGYYQNQRFDTIIEQPTPVNGTSFFAGYRLGRGEFAPYYGERATNRYGEVRAGARVPLLRDRMIDKNRAGVQSSTIGLKIADLNVTQQKVEIIKNAMLRYWDWIASVEKLKIAKNIYNIAKDRQEQIQKRVKAGDLPRIEETENKRIVLQRKSQLVVFEQLVISSANELSLYLMTDENKAYIPTEDEVPDNPFSQFTEEVINIDIVVESAIKNRPEIQRLHAQKEQNRIERELAKNLSKPGIDFVLSVSQDFGPGSKTLAQPEMEASLILNVPMQNKTQEGKIDGAQAKIAKLDSQEDFLKERITTDLKNITSLLSMTKERVAISTSEVELSKELETAELKKFQMGEGTLILVNIRELTTAEARIREIDSLADHNRAIVNFKASTLDLLNFQKK